MRARVWRAMARLEDSLWGDAVGVACMFVLLWVGLWLPLVIGGR
jgi:hypothetical protein